MCVTCTHNRFQNVTAASTNPPFTVQHYEALVTASKAKFVIRDAHDNVNVMRFQ
jgi:hypothetical protein